MNDMTTCANTAVTVALKQRIIAAASAERMTVSAWIRQAVTEKLDRETGE